MPPTGDLACNPGLCPDWESNQQPFGLEAGTKSTEPHQPELLYFLWHLKGTFLFIYSYLIDEETEAQRGSVTEPRNDGVRIQIQTHLTPKPALLPVMAGILTILTQGRCFILFKFVPLTKHFHKFNSILHPILGDGFMKIGRIHTPSSIFPPLHLIEM